MNKTKYKQGEIYWHCIYRHKIYIISDEYSKNIGRFCIVKDVSGNAMYHTFMDYIEPLQSELEFEDSNEQK